MANELKKAYAAYKGAKHKSAPGSKARRAALEKILDLGGAKDIGSVISHRSKKGAGAKKKARPRVKKTKTKQTKVKKKVKSGNKKKK